SGLPGAFVFFGDPVRARGAQMPGPASPPSRARKMLQRFLVPSFVGSVWFWLSSRSTVSCRAEVELSPNLRFGRRCTVSSFTKIKAEGPLRIGARSGFATGCFVSSGRGGIDIGEHVLVGPNVSIVGSKYVHDELDVPFEDQGHESIGIRIGNNVWIGAGSVVADGAVLGDNTIVAAGSVVNRRFPSNVIIAGSPAKVVLRRDRKPGGKPACASTSSKSSAAPSPA
ncbi:MAG: acyltransferase, partial [bacterium]